MTEPQEIGELGAFALQPSQASLNVAVLDVNGASYLHLVPYGRIGKPEEVATLVAFLASDEAAFMCGSLVEITGAQAVA